MMAPSECADPVLVALAERDRALAVWKITPESVEEAWERADEAWVAAEDRMIETPATTVAGIIAKLRLIQECFEEPSGEDLPTDQRALVSAIADLERLSGE